MEWKEQVWKGIGQRVNNSGGVFSSYSTKAVNSLLSILSCLVFAVIVDWENSSKRVRFLSICKAVSLCVSNFFLSRKKLVMKLSMPWNHNHKTKHLPKNVIFSLEASLQALHRKKSQITQINLTGLKSQLYTSIAEKLKCRLCTTNPAGNQSCTWARDHRISNPTP